MPPTTLDEPQLVVPALGSLQLEDHVDLHAPMWSTSRRGGHTVFFIFPQPIAQELDMKQNGFGETYNSDTRNRASEQLSTSASQ